VTSAPRVAIVVDWLSQFGGAERVISEIAATFPGASIFALFDDMAAEARARIPAGPTRTSFLQQVPDIGKRYRSLLPLMPRAIRSLDVRDFDVVISSHHAVAKGIRVRREQLHLCYCHSPVRYAWDQREQYLADHGITGAKATLARLALERVRRWDLRTASSVDRFVVNSENVAGRVKRFYGRESVVAYPPVDLDFFTPGGPRADRLYVCASRQVPYKRLDRIVDAFIELPTRRLVVLGDGPQHDRIRERAQGHAHIMVRGEVSASELRDWFRRARAFVFAADEDFGLVPLEAQACGTPVLALHAGGALETVRGEPGNERTGLFFDESTPEAIRDAVSRFEGLRIPPSPFACRANAERFNSARFRAILTAEVQDGLAQKRGARAADA
jgi:glycosyltransferase involved in cell wall biosynthesis